MRTVEPWVPGNRVQLLENGEEYYPKVLAAIAAADTEIIVETFILFEDKVGNAFQKALIDAARRGVRVDLTVDGYGSFALSAEFIGAMTEVGIRYHVYRPQPRLFGLRSDIFRRLHRKIVVVDGRLAYVGGINICHEHIEDFGEESKQDYAVEMEGPIVAPIARHSRLFVARLMQQNGETPPQELLRNLPAPERSGDTDTMFVVRDNDRHHSDIERHYRLALRLAKRRVVIANAYFFPGMRLMRALRGAARRGVEVVLILQGKPDMPKVKWLAETLYDDLLSAGVKIYEYCERPLHGKVAVVDDHWATVGSSNLDPLSLYLNLESNLMIRDAAFNESLTASLARLATRSCQKVDPRTAPRRAWIGRALSFLAYHLMRRFPRWGGWQPAHAESAGVARGT
jgi:cardiolipin synthase